MYNPIFVIDGHTINLAFLVHAEIDKTVDWDTTGKSQTIDIVRIKYIDGDEQFIRGTENIQKFFQQCEMRGYMT